MNKGLRYVLDWIELPTDIFYVTHCPKEHLQKHLFRMNDWRCSWRKRTKTFKVIRWIIIQRIKSNQNENSNENL